MNELTPAWRGTRDETAPGEEPVAGYAEPNELRTRYDSPRLSTTLRRVTVSRVFWDAVKEELPSLNTRRGYRDLFWYLLLGSWHDGDTNRLLLPSELLCSFEGRSPLNSRAEAFLRRFREEVIMPLDGCLSWSGWDPLRDKCRQLIDLDFGRLQPFVEAEYREQWHHLGRVYLDGQTFSTRTIRQARREELREVQALQAYCHEAESIRTYLNSLPPNLFTQCVARNYAAAQRAALNLKDEAVRNEQLQLLRCIAAQPQPFYSPSSQGNTVRLFTAQSMPNLQRDVRKELTRSWLDVDVRCSQLAICAAAWDAEPINSFLRSGENYWTLMLQSIGVPQNERDIAKGAIKPTLYSICYGMELHHVKGTTALRLKKAGLDTHLATRFVNHPLTKALFEAREEALNLIARAGGATTCFGKWCAVSETRHPRQIMAEVAQALEMKLIYPAFRLAQETREFTIVLFQHDGFSLHFLRRNEMWQERIAHAIQEEINHQGVATKLEWQLETGQGPK